jgi:hypothetical protein
MPAPISFGEALAQSPLKACLTGAIYSPLMAEPYSSSSTRRETLLVVGAALIAGATLVHQAGRSYAAVSTWIGLALFCPAFFGFLANALAMTRRQPVPIRMYADERREKPRSDAASTTSLGFFAAFAAAALLVPDTEFFWSL